MDDKNKYNNALEKLQEALAPKDGCEISGLTRACIESIFPELKESEDENEKIRKELIEHIKANKWADYVLFQKFSPDDVIAWLEKQGEKPQGKSALEAIKEEKVNNKNCATDKVEQKFKVGDWVVISTTKGDRVVQIASVEYFTKDGHSSYITTEGRWFGNGTEARLLTDKDVEIATIPESKAIVNKIESWSEEDEKNLKRAIWYVENPALNVVKDTMLSEWLKSIKGRVQPQPKQ